MKVFIRARHSIYKVSGIKDITDFIQDLNLLASDIKCVCFLLLQLIFVD